jgi:hypothetical protein
MLIRNAQQLILLIILTSLLLASILMHLNSTSSTASSRPRPAISNTSKKPTDADFDPKRSQKYFDLSLIEQAPLIFVGGSQRSGTTLMRALLDVHKSVSCGTEVKFKKRPNFSC